MITRKLAGMLAGLALVSAGCKGAGREAAVKVDSTQLVLFAAMPGQMGSLSGNVLTAPKVDLGRALFYEARLSAGNDLSCNSCHRLDAYGADTGAVSIGHQGKKGARNSPTVYNAAGQVAQFWDGRAADVEEQAKGPILNPVEMAMPSGPAVIARLRRDPAYRRMFAAAFPGERDPVTYDNLGRAIGAFERQLVTPARWDDFLNGHDSALTNAEKAGFNTFASVGCAGCHSGVWVGGMMYQRAGLVRSWPDTTDFGRMAVTHQPSDRMVFKVPSLRNIEHTAPYFHNGAVRSLDTAVVWMARHQLGKELSAQQVTQIVTWLRALSGPLPTQYIARPAATPRAG
jgi:cytochrome c peroxidase